MPLRSDAAESAGRFSIAAPDGGTVHVLAVDPTDPSVLYAGSHTAGVFRSLDGGGSWQGASRGLTGEWVSTLAVAPSDPRVLYVGVFPGSRSGVFRSQDHGATWASIGGTKVPGAWGLAVHPTDPDLVVVTHGDKVWKTTDAGASWVDVTPEAEPGVFITFRVPVFDPTPPWNLYVGTNGGILKTPDLGETWIRKRPNAFVMALIVDPHHPQSLWAGIEGGVLRTLDGGGSWSFLALPVDPYDDVTALAVDPADPQVVYAAAGSSSLEGTLFRSDDGGATWRRLLTTTGVSSLVADRQRPGTLWAGLSRLGVIKSTDGGATWSAARAGLKASGVTALAVDPHQPGTLVAGLEGGLASLARSDDGGETWTPVEVSLGHFGIASNTDGLLPEPRQPGLLYGIFSGILRRSRDFGLLWEPLPGLPPFPVVSLAVTDGLGHLAAVTQETIPCNLGFGCPPTLLAHLFHSLDGGATWEESALPQQSFLGKGLLAGVPSDPSVVYLALENLFTSRDGGATWLQVSPLPLLPLFDLVVDPAHPRTLYAATRLRAGGVLRSLDGGETWHPRGAGLPIGEFVSQVIRDLLIDSRDPQRLYAASDLGVFESRNGGESWQPYSEGLEGLPATVLALDPRGAGTLYAGGPSGGGLFARSGASEVCAEGPTSLCLQGGRFRVEVTWQDFQGGQGAGHSVPLRDDSGAFWFFDSENLEVVVKVLDGRQVNDHFWVFLGSLTNVAFEVWVTDTVTGKDWHHSNPARHFASLGDVTAF